MPNSIQLEAAEDGEVLVTGSFGNKVPFDPDRAAKRKSDKKEKARRKKQKAIAERDKAIQLLPKIQAELNQERKRSDYFASQWVQASRDNTEILKPLLERVRLERQAVEWADRIAQSVKQTSSPVRK